MDSKKKIKLLYDVDTLLHEQRTGVGRVADVLLKKFSENKNFDVYLYKTSKKRKIDTYLSEEGLSSLKDKVYVFSVLKNSINKKFFLKRIITKTKEILLKPQYTKRLKQFDCFFSPFLPISPIVKKTGITTAMVIYDMIPIVRPEFYTDKKTKKYAKKHTRWMKYTHPDIIFVSSKNTKTDFLAFRKDYAAKDIHIVPLAAEDHFKREKDKRRLNAVKEKYNIPSKNYLLSVSAESPRKNFLHLVKAFLRFLEMTKTEDISLVLTGPKLKTDSPVSLLLEKKPQYKKQICQTGFVDEKDMSALYSGATAFIYPSLYEGFGLPPLEAMKCGTPVISADNSSLPEVSGNAALYISGKDEEETAKVLKKICTDKKLREKMTQKGLRRAKEFNWNKTADIIVKHILKKIK